MLKFLHIFLNFLIQKLKIKYKMKLLELFFLIICVPFCKSIKISNENEKNLETSFNTEENILMKGWLKYFVYSPKNEINEKPKSFFINKKYFQQFDAKNPLAIINPSNKNKDSFGSIDIPSQFHFFFVLTKKTLYVISARQVNSDFS